MHAAAAKRFFVAGIFVLQATSSVDSAQRRTC
jgi:hypothetical protein